MILQYGQVYEIPGGDEVWKDVVNYEGIYQVSNHGRVRRVAPVGGRGAHVRCKVWSDGYPVIKPHDNGYRLSKDNIPEDIRAPRLMLEAFVGTVPPGARVEVVRPQVPFQYAVSSGANVWKRKAKKARIAGLEAEIAYARNQLRAAQERLDELVARHKKMARQNVSAGPAS